MVLVSLIQMAQVYEAGSKVVVDIGGLLQRLAGAVPFP